MGVSENRGTLKQSYDSGVYIRVPYFRKPPNMDLVCHCGGWTFSSDLREHTENATWLCYSRLRSSKPSHTEHQLLHMGGGGLESTEFFLGHQVLSSQAVLQVGLRHRTAELVRMYVRHHNMRPQTHAFLYSHVASPGAWGSRGFQHTHGFLCQSPLSLRTSAGSKGPAAGIRSIRSSCMMTSGASGACRRSLLSESACSVSTSRHLNSVPPLGIPKDPAASLCSSLRTTTE